MKSNQKTHKKQAYIFRENRIETLFSLLPDQSMIRINYAKYFDALKARILSNTPGLTTIQHVNKFILDRNIDTS